MSAAFFFSLGLLVASLVLGVSLSRRVNIAVPTTIGALLTLAFGLSSWPRVGELWLITWDATFTLVGLVLIAHLLDEAGFFGYWAVKIARATGGNGLLAWLGLMALTTLVTAFLANDGSVLIMTPIVVELVLALEWPRETALAFLLSQGFLVDATSTLLATSNLTNILTADAFHLSFLAYLRLNWLGWLATLAGAIAILYVHFRPALSRRFDPAALPAPEAKIADPLVFRAGGWVLGALAIAYVVNSYFRLPTSVLVGAGAIALAGVAHRGGKLSWGALAKAPPWHVVIFAQAMFVLVDAVSAHGLTALTIRFAHALGNGPWAQGYGFGLGESVLSALTNNLPALLVAVLALQQQAGSQWLHLQLAAAVVGADIGSKLTPIGSLATLMWLYLLKGRGVSISWREYLAFALVVTPPVVLLTLAVLIWHLTQLGL